MLYSQVTPSDKRRGFRAALAAARSSGEPLRVPGAFNPLSARLIQDKGFEGVYVSGAVLSADLGLPDIGLTTLTEVAGRSQQIARVTDLPTLVDADTGFGEPMNVARTVQTLEDAGVAGAHVEDQVNPKRCGHLDGKEVVGLDEAVKRVRAAADARRDPGFLVMARTDVRGTVPGPDGLRLAVDRAKALVDAGADAIFPEAMADLGEFEAVASAVDVPVLANMTEFGKSELFTRRRLGDAGVALIIYPVTLLRIAMGAAERALDEIAATGTQAGQVEGMQTRARLYELLDYAAYNQFDEGIFTYRP
ncbi:methylisocitrate lyase [Cellulosimicrobium arenosum]|uniref:Methylisocitrate lyase n=1 Tax=Cellulosimicrobium arenosum TaxID=2708133 RepID=A0A927J0W5_9MICO|nr:methylisocitrate lyase [Cellulosimicrobium arenosum]MBD8079755.1 methylisocitrate lyase [Cellulosimicrobium arenosum]